MHIAGQLLRSGTSGAPNDAEARAAESLSVFIHKLGIVLKELNESNVWLAMIQKRSFVTEEAVAPVLDECSALSKIIAVSRRTAAQNAGRIRQGSDQPPLLVPMSELDLSFLGLAPIVDPKPVLVLRWLSCCSSVFLD